MATIPQITSPGIRKAWDAWIQERTERFAAVGMVHPDLEPVSEIVALAMMARRESRVESNPTES